MGTRSSLDLNFIYTYHPISRLDLQSPLALATTNTNSPPDLLSNHYINGTLSDDSVIDSSISIYLQLSNTRPHDILHLLVI